MKKKHVVRLEVEERERLREDSVGRLLCGLEPRACPSLQLLSIDFELSEQPPCRLTCR